MHSRFLPLLRNEITKAGRRKVPYFGIGAIGLLCVIIYAFAGQVSSAASANAWGYVAISMELVFNDLGPIFILMFSAMLLSEETGTGTIRAALAAPVYRWEFYLAKAVVGLLYMLAVSLAALVFSAALARIHYQFGAVGDAMGIVYTPGRAVRELLLGIVLSWIPLGALVMYGLLISALVRSPGAAVSAAIATFFISEFAKHLVGLDPYLFTKYLGHSWVTLQQLAQGLDYQWRPAVWKMLGLSLAYGTAAFGAGLAVFVREDLNH
jgi:ABC-type transport system involved in multi-copper enzyme maturation permease subunit